MHGGLNYVSYKLEEIFGYNIESRTLVSLPLPWEGTWKQQNVIGCQSGLKITRCHKPGNISTMIQN